MITTKEYLNAVKAKTGADSDYALAQKLNTSKQLISGYMKKGLPMGNQNALKVASILDIDYAIVLAAVEAERAKSEAEKRAWTTLFERLGGIAAAVVVGIGLTGSPAPLQAQSASTSPSLYIM